MLQLNTLRNHKDDTIKRLTVKNFDGKALIDQILQLDDERKATKTELDQNLAQVNSISKEIGVLFGQGKKEEAEGLKQKTQQFKIDSKQLDEKLTQIEKDIADLLVRIPNLPNQSVPLGKTPEDNVEIRRGGQTPVLSGGVPHWDLTAKYDIIDFELGNKITGSGFPVYKGKGAKLQRALISFFLDRSTAAGYLEIQPPLMVNKDTGFGTGQLPDKEGQMYYMPADDYYMIPTSEVPVTNIYRDVIVKEEELPIKMTAYSACFRREAGSYGKDVRGLNRLHQFDKVEIVQIEHPDRSYETLDKMVTHVEGLLKELELPYRIIKLCGGDMSFASALTYDFEVFSAAQQKWLEVSSVSNFESFQTNRMKLRFKDKAGKTQLAHTLNGSALALPRIVAALLENNQTPEGIKLPQVLHSYTGFKIIN